MPAEIWGIWLPDVERLLRMPTVMREWTKLRAEFENRPEFVIWVNRCQRKSTPPKEFGASARDTIGVRRGR
jgi:hypothetical protein